MFWKPAEIRARFRFPERLDKTSTEYFRIWLVYMSDTLSNIARGEDSSRSSQIGIQTVATHTFRTFRLIHDLGFLQ